MNYYCDCRQRGYLPRCGYLLFMVACINGLAHMARTEELVEKAKRNAAQYIAVMQMLEAKLHSSQDQLVSWSGTYSLSEQTRLPSVYTIKHPAGAAAGTAPAVEVIRGDFWQSRVMLIRFTVDLRKNMLLTTYEQVGQPVIKNLRTGEIETIEVVPVRVRHMVTTEHWIEAKPAPDTTDVLPLVFARGAGVNSATRKAPEKVELVGGTIVDPRQFFIVGGLLPSTRLRMYITALEKGDATPCEIIETSSPLGTVYTVRQENRAGGPNSKEKATVLETTYDPAADYQVSSFKRSTAHGFVDEEAQTSFTTIAGILIPKSYHWKRNREDGQPFSEREFTLSDAKVNEPVNEEMFSWTSLGLQEGDQIQDEIGGAVLRYHEGNVVPAEQYVDRSLRTAAKRETGVEHGTRINVKLILVNVGFLLVLIVIFALRRHRRRVT